MVRRSVHCLVQPMVHGQCTATHLHRSKKHTPIPLAGSVEKHWLIPGTRSPGLVLPAPTTLARSLPTLPPLKPHTNSEPVNLTHTQLRSRTLEAVKHSCSESPE